MLKAFSRNRSLGKEWHARFIARNDEVKTARSKSIDYKRVNGATAVNINLFFDRLNTPEVANIPPARFYNADEIGMGQGVSNNHFVVTDSTLRQTFKKAIEKGK